MSLDIRLKDLKIDPYILKDATKLSSEDIEAITQAFIDEGWVKPEITTYTNGYSRVDKYEPYYCLTHNMYRSRCAAYPHARKDNRLTGPEWLARFEKELTAMPCDERYVLNGGATTVETHSMSQVEKAARRAAGVDHE